jgi:hypothetical protein
MTTVALAPSVGNAPTNLELLDKQLRHQLVKRITADPEFHAMFGHELAQAQHAWAERILDQAEGFLRLCALDPDGHYSPSPAVDIGWHVFILHTRDYARFCQEIAGGFIHHVPTSDEDKKAGHFDHMHTPNALREHGIAVDDALWPMSAECGGQKCYSCVPDN